MPGPDVVVNARAPFQPAPTHMVPLSAGPFHLDDYVHYIQDFIRHIGADKLHVVSVCQPTVPVLAAISLLASSGEATPRTMTMMGGPIDTRVSPTKVNDLATTQPMSCPAPRGRRA